MSSNLSQKVTQTQRETGSSILQSTYCVRLQKASHSLSQPQSQGSVHSGTSSSLARGHILMIAQTVESLLSTKSSALARKTVKNMNTIILLMGMWFDPYKLGKLSPSLQALDIPAPAFQCSLCCRPVCVLFCTWHSSGHLMIGHCLDRTTMPTVVQRNGHGLRTRLPSFHTRLHQEAVNLLAYKIQIFVTMKVV